MLGWAMVKPECLGISVKVFCLDEIYHLNPWNVRGYLTQAVVPVF